MAAQVRTAEAGGLRPEKLLGSGEINRSIECSVFQQEEYREKTDTIAHPISEASHPVITSFADKETEKLWQGIRSRRLPPDIQSRALSKLQLVNAAVELNFLKLPPGNRLEVLAGDRKGQYSIRINDQWRICFVWTGTDAEEVEITDYH